MRSVLVLFVLAACGSTSSQPPAVDASTSNGSPQILTLSTNTFTLSEKDQLVVTAVVTDADGVDDLIGGALDDPDTGGTYGAFATSATEGAYELTLSWSAIEQVHAIDAPIGGASRDFRARFYDQAGHAAEQAVTVQLHCSMSGYALCDGQCTNLAMDAHNCGKCGATIPEGQECEGGRATCVLGPENTVAACSDGCSNDGDAYTDCDDYDCCNVVTCAKGTACNP